MVLLGDDIFDAVYKKVDGLPNDTRTPARIQEDGSIRLFGFVLTNFTGQYWHPGNVGGSIAEGYYDVIGKQEVMMYDPAAPWTLLRVLLDAFTDPTVPLRTVAKMNDDETEIKLYFQSKPFPIPPYLAITRTDATVTA